MPIISGSGGGSGLPLTGGTLTGPLVLAPTSASAIPLSIRASGAARADDYFNVTDTDTGFAILAMDSNGNESMYAVGTGALGARLRNDGRMFDLGIGTQALTAGALPTVAPVSGTAFQCSTSRDVFLAVPFTGDATNNAATLKIELSPDNVTFSILDTLSIAAALNLTGAINTPVTVLVPVSWYVKLTAVHGTIGTSTYY